MRIIILAVGMGLLAAGVIAYSTGVMTVAEVSYPCRVQGGPCPSSEGDTLRNGQLEEFWGATSIVIGVVLSVLGLGMGVRSKQSQHLPENRSQGN